MGKGQLKWLEFNGERMITWIPEAAQIQTSKVNRIEIFIVKAEASGYGRSSLV